MRRRKPTTSGTARTQGNHASDRMPGDPTVSVRDASFGETTTFNARMVAALIYGGCAWVLWPTSPQWWGLAVTSTLFGMGSLASLIAALGSLRASWQRRRVVHRFLVQGTPQKAAPLADHETLRKAGMLE
ncbi:hypothetical protein [Stappia indica]|uniref:hypothetical protein n=1 Tax=Stappia indica TaxID=538381 RepID=UPI001D185F22|nr:hypothetical protein [Stappia indica]MCC4242957.1 hypothetical protein [Stappia indica]